jgi:NADH-quinone oxidoreductase subunit E
MLLSENAYKKIDAELTKYPADKKQSALIAALAIAQDEKGWVSTEVIQDIALYLEQPPIAVQEVATFYNMFDIKPVGKFKITVCTNLPCALSHGDATAAYLQKKLGIAFRETTPDGMFTLIEGECMGACGDSPVLLVNNKHMCIRMSTDRIDSMLEELKQAAEQEQNAGSNTAVASAAIVASASSASSASVTLEHQANSADSVDLANLGKGV